MGFSECENNTRAFSCRAGAVRLGSWPAPTPAPLYTQPYVCHTVIDGDQVYCCTAPWLPEAGSEHLVNVDPEVKIWVDDELWSCDTAPSPALTDLPVHDCTQDLHGRTHAISFRYDQEGQPYTSNGDFCCSPPLADNFCDFTQVYVGSTRWCCTGPPPPPLPTPAPLDTWTNGCHTVIDGDQFYCCTAPWIQPAVKVEPEVKVWVDDELWSCDTAPSPALTDWPVHDCTRDLNGRTHAISFRYEQDGLSSLSGDFCCSPPLADDFCDFDLTQVRIGSTRRCCTGPPPPPLPVFP